MLRDISNVTKLKTTSELLAEQIPLESQSGHPVTDGAIQLFRTLDGMSALQGM